MAKKILYSLLVIVILLVSGFLILVTTLDSVVKEAVEKNTSQITGGPVTVESVDFSLFSGKGSINGLQVSNPPGFSERPALTLGIIKFEIEMSSLSPDIITVKEIKADSTVVFLEKNGDGKINFQVLSQNLRKASEEQQPAERAANSWMPNFKISQFILTEGKVTLSGFGKNPNDIKIPEIRLQNIGGADGASPEKAGEEIMSRIFSEIIRQSLQSGLQKWIEKNTAIPEALKKLIGQGLGSVN